MNKEDIAKVMSLNNVPLTGKEEVLSYDLWSYLYYIDNTTTELSFFGYAFGQNVPNSPSTQVASKRWTNLTKPNEVSAPYRFLLREIAIDVRPAVSGLTNGTYTQDKIKVLESGYWEFKIASKSYQEGRLNFVPEICKTIGYAGYATTATTTTKQVEVASQAGARYMINPEILLVNNLTFAFTMKWDTPVNTEDNLVIGVIFRGLMVRPAQ